MVSYDGVNIQRPSSCAHYLAALAKKFISEHRCVGSSTAPVRREGTFIYSRFYPRWRHICSTSGVRLPASHMRTDRRLLYAPGLLAPIPPNGPAMLSSMSLYCRRRELIKRLLCTAGPIAAVLAELVSPCRYLGTAVLGKFLWVWLKTALYGADH